VLLAAAQLCCAGFMSETAHADGWSSVWSDLWHTPDQQGQAMLDAGQPAQAANRFHDPRRRAYADLAAARYGEAARLLAPFHDARSQYNRGNALAGSGQLPAALAAYEAALKLTPTDRDVRHNRDLIERALQQQQQQAPQNRSGPGSRQPGARNPQSGHGAQSGANGSQAGAGNSASANGQPNAPQASAPARGGNSREASGEAQRDAAFAAANARTPRQQNGSRGTTQSPGSDAGSVAAGGEETPKEQPESERQLMLDQWLRQIPDSPAGLLQRQFLIEHMMQQQGGGESQAGGP
jgi:Ca-activated chloride channel family protein